MKNLVFIFILLAMLSCRKKMPEQAVEPSGEMTRGFPSNKNDIHGYLAVSYSITNQYVHDYQLHGAFADPARDLLSGYNTCNGGIFDKNTCGIVDVGTMRYNHYASLLPAANGNSILYSKIISASEPQDSVRWFVPGNRSFAKINECLYKPYATFIDFPSSKRKISISKPYTFYVDSIYKNFDEISVFIDDGYNPQYGIRKASAGGSIVFQPEELKTINAANNNYFRVTFAASQFYYKVVQGKTFVFECSHKTIINATILP
jgi:hypothetical protein